MSKLTTKANKLTFVITVILMAGRVLQSLLLISVWKEGGVPRLWETSYDVSAYLLISAILFVHRRESEKLNIDKSFMIVFILLGGLYAFLLPRVAGIVLGVLALFNLLAFWVGLFQFEVFRQKASSVWIVVMLYFVPDVLLMVVPGKFPILQNGDPVLRAVFMANAPLVVFEEVIYRALLWRVLKTLDLPDAQVVVIQGILFWLAHINYAFTQPWAFWVFVPIASILLGLVVLRSKSIALTSAIHYLHNVLVALPY